MKMHSNTNEIKDSIKYHKKVLQKHQMSLRNAQNDLQIENIKRKIKCTEVALKALEEYMEKMLENV